VPTVRLNATERAAARRYAAGLLNDPHGYSTRYSATPTEPALGALEQRLRILVARLGGRVKVASPTPAERALVEVSA